MRILIALLIIVVTSTPVLAQSGNWQEMLERNRLEIQKLEKSIIAGEANLKAQAEASAEWQKLNAVCLDLQSQMDVMEAQESEAPFVAERRWLEKQRRNLQDELEVAEAACTTHLVANVWGAEELEEYFSNVHLYIYQSLNQLRNTVKYPAEYVPWDISRLQNYTVLGIVPANPCNGWRPVEFKSIANGFSAGDLLLQFPPPEFTPYQVGASYFLSIYGPTEDFCASTADPYNLGDFRDRWGHWAQLPDGAIRTLGIATQTEIQTEHNTSLGYT